MGQTNPEMESLKTRLKSMWMAGDFGRVAKDIETGAEEFILRLALKPSARLLDVACGTGNLAIPAARAGAIVTGVDIAPNLLEQARARAASEGLTIQFDEGDADGQAALRSDLERLWAEHNKATDGTTHVEGEYLEVLATRG